MPKSFKNTAILLDRIWASEDLQSTFDLADSFAKLLGFKMTTMACFGGMLVKPGKLPPFISSGEPEHIETYKRNNFYEIDPVVQMAQRSVSPFPYSDAYRDPTTSVAAFRTTAIEHGYGNGWAFPVHKNGQPSGTLLFGAPDAIALTAQEKLQLNLVSTVTYEKGLAFFGDEIEEFEFQLSDRERSVLTLVARGKTNWEIGAVLSISEYSVRDYLKTLSVKLETSNRTHTVARAMQLGLILP